MRRLLGLLVLLTALALGLIAFAYATARSDPLVRHQRIGLGGWPAGAPALRIILISDIHVAGPDMPPERLGRIVARINGLRPDLVLIAGDLVSDKRLSTRLYSMAEAVAPLAELEPTIATFAVLGNHDHWRNAGAARAALRQAGIGVLDNRAVRVGPIVLAGADDVYTRHADPAALARDAKRLGGPALVLSHSPDIVPRLDPRFRLVLAGHTHCGQIELPLIGRLSTASNYGERYACGVVREKGRITVVTAGLGTSVLPLRIGAVPDMWLLELGPVRSAVAR